MTPIRRHQFNADKRWACKALLILCAATLMLLGCEQKMAQQPSYRPLEASKFFADGRASRPLVSGTVPQGTLEDDSALFTGRKSTAPQRTMIARSTAGNEPSSGQNNAAAGGVAASTQPPLSPDEFATELPFPLTKEVLERGQERYSIYCIVCHGPTGAGDGTIVRRGFTPPPSYITDNSRQFARSGFQVKLRDVPLGYLFEVATHGYGAMADYALQVEPRDRWAIAAYIRTLQFSQQVPLEMLPPGVQTETIHSLETTP